MQTKTLEPAKQAAARTKSALVSNTTRCRPFHGLILIYVAFLGLTPPGFMLAPAFAGWNDDEDS